MVNPVLVENSQDLDDVGRIGSADEAAPTKPWYVFFSPDSDIFNPAGKKWDGVVKLIIKDDQISSSTNQDMTFYECLEKIVPTSQLPQ